MLKKTITFKDLDDKPVTKNFYFNFSRSELIKKNMRGMTLDENGEPDIDGFKAELQAIIGSKSGKVIMDTFEEIVREAYGERNADNIAFDKSPEISARFMNSDAYDVLFWELCTNAGFAAEFINGIMPKNLEADLASIGEAPKPPTTIAEISLPARTALGLPKDVSEMNVDELKAALAERTSQGGGQ